MRIQTKATNLTITPEISDYLEKRLNQFQKLIERAPDALASVELGKVSQHHRTGDVFRAEINLTFGGRYYRAVSEASDIHAAIDIAKDEIVAEVKQDRSKHRTLVRRGATQVKNFLKRFYS